MALYQKLYKSAVPGNPGKYFLTYPRQNFFSEIVSAGVFPFSVHPAKLFGIFLCILSAFLFFLPQFVVSLHKQKPPAERPGRRLLRL
jgi:hypothetical protein